jgi:two-component system cell cycle response regulator DivK
MVILVAEDYDDTRSLIKMLLQAKGHRVVEAVNGREAVDLAARERPDLILMDLNMPVMDGIAATRALRERPEMSGMPVVAVTAHCGDGDWEKKALAAGCDECVAKPVNFDLLDDVLARFLPKN